MTGALSAYYTIKRCTLAAACAGRIFGTARAHIPLRGIMPRRSLRIPSPMTCTVVQATHTGDCIRCQKCAQLPPQECSEAGEPTGAREHVCGPDVILTISVKGAREGARVKIMSVGCPQTAGRASRSGVGLCIVFGRRQRSALYGIICGTHFSL